MKRLIVALVAVYTLAACDKPSEGDCKKAIANIRALLGTDKMTDDAGETAAWVRSCRGSAKKSTVHCAMEASTIDQLKRCGLLKATDFEGTEIGTGSASGSGSGSASGSAPPAKTP